MVACDSELAGIRYTALCPKGTRDKGLIDSLAGRLRQVTRLLQNAEDEYYSQIPLYREELVSTRASLRERRAKLMAHVAHCVDGCVRDKSGGLSVSVFGHAGAPSHAKPELPRMEVIAARLREGEALEAIAAEYDRSPGTIRPLLSHAGFSSRDGRPTASAKASKATPTISIVPDEPWRQDAVCAQTDPEAFFPEKGGSTRDAKSVCQGCTVSAECLDYALEHDERHGIWGGLSERDRRKITRALKESA